MKPVLCITLNPAIDLTATVNDLAFGAVNRATESQLGPAGKGLNVARLLVELGQDSIATGFLGQDNRTLFDRLFDNHQNFAGVYDIASMSDEFVDVQGMTRTNIKLVDKGITTDINGVSFVVDDDAKAQFFAKVGALLEQTSATVVAGSLPQGFGTDDFERLLNLLTAHHDKVVVDVSGQALKVALTHKLWLIKPNSDELSEIVGRRVDGLDEQLTAINAIQGDIEHILVSMGDKGVHWFKKTDDTRQIIKAVPPVMSVKSSVGAGDTMVAGMVFGLLQDKQSADVLKFATAMSAHAVTVVGVNAPDQARLDELMDKIAIEYVSNHGKF